MRRSIARRAAWGTLTGLALVVGCESPAWVRQLNESFTAQSAEEAKAAEEHRRTYVETRDRKALYWLLSHRITTGMSYGDVCLALGEDGMREENDNWVKTKGGNYQIGDQAYAFGPDSTGQTVYLVFRDDALVNFEPGEFRK